VAVTIVTFINYLF